MIQFFEEKEDEDAPVGDENEIDGVFQVMRINNWKEFFKIRESGN